MSNALPKSLNGKCILSQNVVAKRKNHYLLEVACTWLLESFVRPKFWEKLYLPPFTLSIDHLLNISILNPLTFVFIKNILSMGTCIYLVVYVSFICFIMKVTNFLLNLFSVHLWNIVLIRKALFAMILQLKSFVFDTTLFSLNINISFQIVISPPLILLLFQVMMNQLPLLNGSNPDMCINVVLLHRLYLIQILLHLSSDALPEFPPLLIGMAPTIHPLVLSSISVQAFKHECWQQAMKEELRHFRIITRWTLFHVQPMSSPLDASGCIQLNFILIRLLNAIRLVGCP